jgi:hypothetical protein
MKSSLNPSNQLTLVGATLTNSALQTFTLFSSSLIFRDTMLLTNYYGAVEFNDGNPDTAAEDYFTWEISIDDPNDTDLDTIPDFSDNPEIVLPRAPSLVLARGPTNLLLSISGDIGRTHRILQKTVLNSANWTTNLSVQLTNDPQIVSLPLPPAATSFWQVLAE